MGRHPHERAWLANAFVAKSLLGLDATVDLIDRLTVDRALRRICGFPRCKKLPSESTFSRAFDEFAEGKVAERVHDALIKEYLGGELIVHLSRDGTAIEARERPKREKPIRPRCPNLRLTSSLPRTRLRRLSRRLRQRDGDGPGVVKTRSRQGVAHQAVTSADSGADDGRDSHGL